MSAAEAKENEVETSTESSPKPALITCTKSKTPETLENEDTTEKNGKDDDSNDRKQDNENELVGNNENEEEDEDDDVKMDKNNDKNKNKNKKRKRDEDEDVNVNGDNGEPSKKKIKKSAKNDDSYVVKDIRSWTFQDGQCLYKVEWEGYEEKTWEPIQNVAHNDKFMKFIQNLQTSLVRMDEGGLLKTIREFAPDKLKARLIERASNTDAYDKIALKQLFKIEPVGHKIL